MKKILFSLIVGAVLGGMLSAQPAQSESGLKPSVTAEASVTWGIDLGIGNLTEKPGEKTRHGFENKIKMNISLPLYQGTLSRDTEGDVYTKFKIGVNLGHKYDSTLTNSYSSFSKTSSDANFGYKPANNALHDIAASLHFFGAYLTVFNRPNFKTDYAKLWSPIKGYPRQDPFTTATDIKAFGTKLGYKNENIADSGIDLDAGIKFGSNGSWKDYTREELVDIKPGEKVAGRKLYEIEKVKYVAGIGYVFTKNSKPKKFAGDTASPTEAGQYIEELSDIEPSKEYYAVGFDLKLKYDKWVYSDMQVNTAFGNINNFYKSGLLLGGSGGKPSSLKGNGTYIGGGFKLGTKAVDGLDVSIAMDAAGVVANIDDETKKHLGLDLAFDAKYKWVSAGIYYGNDHSQYGTIKYKADDSGKGVKEDHKMGDMAVKLTFESKNSGDTNFVEGLAFGLDLRFNRLLSHFENRKVAVIKNEQDRLGIVLPIGIKTWVNYKYNISDSMWLKPYTSVWIETNHSEGLDLMEYKRYTGIAYELGLIFSPIEKVEIEAKWAHGKLGGNYAGLHPNKYPINTDESKMIKAPVNQWQHNGTFTLGLKIIY